MGWPIACNAERRSVRLSKPMNCAHQRAFLPPPLGAFFSSKQDAVQIRRESIRYGARLPKVQIKSRARRTRQDAIARCASEANRASRSVCRAKGGFDRIAGHGVKRMNRRAQLHHNNRRYAAEDVRRRSELTFADETRNRIICEEKRTMRVTKLSVIRMTATDAGDATAITNQT